MTLIHTIHLCRVKERRATSERPEVHPTVASLCVQDCVRVHDDNAWLLNYS
jgi:hypothetical protein